VGIREVLVGRADGLRPKLVVLDFQAAFFPSTRTRRPRATSFSGVTLFNWAGHATEISICFPGVRCCSVEKQNAGTGDVECFAAAGLVHVPSAQHTVLTSRSMGNRSEVLRSDIYHPLKRLKLDLPYDYTDGASAQ
jgi:hypothetical protein